MGFSLRPDFGTYAVLTQWDDPEDYKKFASINNLENLTLKKGEYLFHGQGFIKHPTTNENQLSMKSVRLLSGVLLLACSAAIAEPAERIVDPHLDSHR